MIAKNVWRWRRKGLAAYSLEADGKYAAREFSLNLPMLRVRDLEPFLEFELSSNETGPAAKRGSFIKRRRWRGRRDLSPQIPN